MRKLDEEVKKDKPEAEEEKAEEQPAEAEDDKVEIPDESELIDWKEQSKPQIDKPEPLAKEAVPIEETAKLEADLFEPEDRLEWLREQPVDIPDMQPEAITEAFPSESTVTGTGPVAITLAPEIPIDIIDTVDLPLYEDIDPQEFLEPMPLDDVLPPEPEPEEVGEV